MGTAITSTLTTPRRVFVFAWYRPVSSLCRCRLQDHGGARDIGNYMSQSTRRSHNDGRTRTSSTLVVLSILFSHAQNRPFHFRKASGTTFIIVFYSSPCPCHVCYLAARYTWRPRAKRYICNQSTGTAKIVDAKRAAVRDVK
jgi:hypothetical protein